MPSLAMLFDKAHPNSILNRKFPTGCTVADLPNWHADRSDAVARVNSGFPDDYEPFDPFAGGWDDPTKDDGWSDPSPVHLPSVYGFKGWDDDSEGLPVAA